ncbi:MAG TPA: non-heme iron oxygenase ferredoxin subunit [Longimicrobiales bacterium]|nr:non-heme iron oxygenase ferredoxin subunit [Longimicrobiales bacterium]
MAEWIKVAEPGAVGVGTLKGVTVRMQPLVLVNVDGDLYCLEDQCSHEAFPLSDGELDGSDLLCTYHGARFDACTGRNKALPAVRPVKSYPVQVRDDGIYVEL